MDDLCSLPKLQSELHKGARFKELETRDYVHGFYFEMRRRKIKIALKNR